jgi:hypothetical protein
MKCRHFNRDQGGAQQAAPECIEGSATNRVSQFDPRIATETLCRSSLCVAEIKRSLSPKIERGFHAACADLAPTRKFVVYPGQERYALAADIEAISLGQLAGALVIGLMAHP